jgi:Recombinase zinc beta ribbon domain
VGPVTVERPDLRIIPDELWTSAHRVMRKRRATYERQSNGRLLNKPETGIESKYLLGGFAKCGHCSGTMSAIKRTGRRGRPAVWYTCSNYRQRGPAACGSKGHGVEASELHGAIVAGLTEILQPEKLDTVAQGPRARVGQPARRPGRATRWAASRPRHVGG